MKCIKILLNFLVVVTLSSSCACKKKSSSDDDSEGIPEDSPGSLLPQYLSAPTNVNDGDRGNSLTNTPQITWDSVSDATSYQIALGKSPGETDTLDWQDVGDVTSTSIDALNLTNGEMYYASVRAIDANSSPGEAGEGNGWQNLKCSTIADTEGAYIKVYGNTTPGLGGAHYDSGSQTLLDWTGANAGNSWTPTRSARKLSDFCVAKYEMKLQHDDEGGDGVVDDPPAVLPGPYDWEADYSNTTLRAKYKAVSVPQAKPWVHITSGMNGEIGAFQACAHLGTGYMLMNNAMWQTVARDIAETSSNWYDGGTEGDVSDDIINSGNSDSDPNTVVAADETGDPDDDPCVNINNANCQTKSDAHFRENRTHSLTNGDTTQKIWDFAGNGHEYIAEQNHRTDGHGAGGADVDEFIVGTSWVGDGPEDFVEYHLQFGPLADYSSIPLGASPRGGLGRFYDTGTPGGDTDPANPGAIMKGGRWGDNDGAGIFTTQLNIYPDTTTNYLTFRCVYAP